MSQCFIWCHVKTATHLPQISYNLPMMCPQGTSRTKSSVLVLSLGSQVLGLGLSLDIKSSAIIPRLVINFVYYFHQQFEHKRENISFWYFTETRDASNCRCGSGFRMSLVLASSFFGFGLGPKSLALISSNCFWSQVLVLVLASLFL